jgi:hypothetical protein
MASHTMTNTALDSRKRFALAAWYGRLLFASTLLMAWMTARVIQDFLFLPTAFDIEKERLADPGRPTADDPARQRLLKQYGVEGVRKPR